MSNGSGTYYILSIGFPSVSNPLCQLNLTLDTAFQGAAFSGTLNGDNYQVLASGFAEIGLPAGAQQLTANVAISGGVATITGTITATPALNADVTLKVLGSSTIAVLAAGTMSVTFTYAFTNQTQGYTYDEVVAHFNRMLDAA
jgi:hypothetical protein